MESQRFLPEQDWLMFAIIRWHWGRWHCTKASLPRRRFADAGCGIRADCGIRTDWQVAVRHGWRYICRSAYSSGDNSAEKTAPSAEDLGRLWTGYGGCRRRTLAKLRRVQY